MDRTYILAKLASDKPKGQRRRRRDARQNKQNFPGGRRKNPGPTPETRWHASQREMAAENKRVEEGIKKGLKAAKDKKFGNRIDWTGKRMGSGIDKLIASVPVETAAFKQLQAKQSLKDYPADVAEGKAKGLEEQAKRQEAQTKRKLDAAARKNPLKASLREGLEGLAKSTPTKLILGGGGAFTTGIAIPKILEKLSPKKTLLQEVLGKGSLGRKAMGLGIGAALIGAGIKGTEKIYSEIERPLKKKIYFNKMMKHTPALKKESPKDVSRIFSTLYKFNPRMASDPLVASSFLRRSLQFKDEGIQPMDVKTLAEVGRNWQASLGRGTSILSDAFPTAASALSGLG